MESTGQIDQLNKTVGKDGKARKQPAQKACTEPSFFAEPFVVDLGKIPTPKMKEKLDALVKHCEALTTDERRALVDALEASAKRFQHYADKLRLAPDQAAPDTVPVRKKQIEQEIKDVDQGGNQTHFGFLNRASGASTNADGPATAVMEASP
jgi:hypothetical protein